VNVSHLELALTIPMEYLPDPRTVLEDAADMEREAKDRALRNKRAQEQAMIKQAERVARQAEREKQKQALLEAKENRGDEMSNGESGASNSKKSKARGSGQDS